MTNDGLEAQHTTVRIADPLVKKAWLATDSKTSLTTIKSLREYASNLNFVSPGTLQLELNISLNNIGPDDLDCLDQIVSAAQDIDIGIEQRLPKIRIRIPHHLVSEALIKRINQLDIYNPPIEFYILVQGTHMSSFFRSDSAVSLSSLLHKHRIRFHVFLLLDLSGDSLESLQKGKVDRFLDWLEETTLNAYPPVFEVGLLPRGRKLSAFAEPLLTLVGRHPDLLESSGSVYCGLLSLLNRVNEIHDLLEEQVPPAVAILSCCGAGISSYCLPSSSLSQIRACPYKISNLTGRSSVMRDMCPSCPWLDYCSGCLIALSQEGKCRLQPYYAMASSALHKWPCVINKLISKKAEMSILEHDWDYIYDPFDVP